VCVARDLGAAGGQPRIRARREIAIWIASPDRREIIYDQPDDRVERSPLAAPAEEESRTGRWKNRSGHGGGDGGIRMSDAFTWSVQCAITPAQLAAVNSCRMPVVAGHRGMLGIAPGGKGVGLGFGRSGRRAAWAARRAATIPPPGVELRRARRVRTSCALYMRSTILVGEPVGEDVHRAPSASAAASRLRRRNAAPTTQNSATCQPSG